MTAIPELIRQAREGMQKALDNTRKEFSGIRSGKATTSLLDLVKVEAYGSLMPLNQVAMVAAPEARMLTVTPFDKSLAPVIEKAIRDGDLGLNPASQGGLIRVPLPALTEERRKELVRVAHQFAEQTRNTIRQIRRDGNDTFKGMERDKEISEDQMHDGQERIQKLTDAYVGKINDTLAAKQKEIMEV